MMAQVVRPLAVAAALWPKWHPYIPRLLNSTASLFSSGSTSQKTRQIFTGIPSARGLRLPDAPPPSGLDDTDGESDSDGKKSRNQKKRDARRAVRWGMELAAFSQLHIKRILRVVSLEEEVFDALMLVKRLGRDVREGKRRQFSYIGRLLREVQPELMDGLIQATKDGDREKFQDLAGLGTWDVGDGRKDAEETDSDDDKEGFQSHEYLDIVTRWFDGLVDKDVAITSEIYSLSSVEFDRQELRRLVRNFCSAQGGQVTLDENEEEVDATLLSAKRSLTRFLLTLAKQLPTE